MSDIKVSVVLPIYNMGKYLRQCLASVLSQSLKDIEVICVNDGSTDNSSDILEEFQYNYPNIIVIDQINQGSGAARNSGINAARGKYIAFIDPDDYYASNEALRTLYERAEQNNAMICGGNVKNSEGEYLYNKFTEDKWIDFTNLCCCNGHCCYIYNLNFLKSNKLYYPNYRRFQDPPFLARVMVVAKQFYTVGIDMYVYRRNHKVLDYNADVAVNVMQGIMEILDIVKQYNFSTELASRELEKNRSDILRHSSEGTPKVREMLMKLNAAILEVLGEQYIITEDEIRLFKKECIYIYESFKKKVPIIVYGAGQIGKSVVRRIDAMNGNIIGIAVSNINNNDFQINKHTVNPIDFFTDLSDQALVIIAVSAKFKHEIMKNLNQYNFKHICMYGNGKMDYIEKVLRKQEAEG